MAIHLPPGEEVALARELCEDGRRLAIVAQTEGDWTSADVFAAVVGGSLGPSARVSDLATASGLSPRSLQRLLRERVGVTPKWVLQRHRVHLAAERALRELREETGVSNVSFMAEAPHWLTYDLPADLTRRNWKGRYRGQKQKWFLLRLTGCESTVCFTRCDRPEFDHWRWVDYWHPLSEVVSFKREVYLGAMRELAPLIGAPAQPAVTARATQADRGLRTQ